jgi:hypothetical protein
MANQIFWKFAAVALIGEWNQMVAAFAGQVKNWLGDGVEAAITDFPDFEHLEAKGRAGH